MLQAIREACPNCEITTLGDGPEALGFIHNPAAPVPDLMVLDLNVPGVEGPAVLNSIRANTRWSGVTVLVFSGSGSAADIARATALGADRYLVKPVNLAGFSRFGETVRELLNRQHIST